MKESDRETDEERVKVAEGRCWWWWGREAGVKNTKAPAVPNSITQMSRNIQQLFDQLM